LRAVEERAAEQGGTMTVDLTGGLPAERDYLLAEPPPSPDVRESASMWVFDDRGAIGLPRVGIEVLASHWDRRDAQVNLCFPDGRLVLVRGGGGPGAGGSARSLRAGALEFRCDEPFARWTLLYDGAAYQTTTDAQIRGEAGGERAHLSIEVEATMAAPPFVQGALVKTAADALAEGVEGRFMGGDRYEQLFTARGSVAIDGDETDFSGSGLRVHRQGPRNTTGFWGHCWQSALFPSGRGFGYIAFPPRADGSPSYNEGYVFTGGRMEPAEVRLAPWLTRLRPADLDTTVVLGTDAGDVRIEGELLFSSVMLPAAEQSELVKAQGGFDMVLQQGGVRYRWDGEESYGMIERSTSPDKLVR
jgi:hypothetical protein